MTPKNKNNNKKGKKISKQISKIPPPIDSTFRVGCILRFQKTATSTANVYVNCFYGMYYVSITAATAVSLYEAIRVKRITVRTMGVVNNSAGGFNMLTNQIMLRLDDAAVAPFGSERRFVDNSMSTSGAVVSAKMTGILGQWMNAVDAYHLAGQRMFSIDGPQGCVVDVKCSIQFNLNRASANGTMVVTGLAPGVSYFNYLDNTSTAGTTAGTQILQNMNGQNQSAAT